MLYVSFVIESLFSEGYQTEKISLKGVILIQSLKVDDLTMDGRVTKSIFTLEDDNTLLEHQVNRRKFARHKTNL